ncbi:MAG: ABC-type transport auxiliary lipoprotein family protein, partial [Kofleriaceae bacterium]
MTSSPALILVILALAMVVPGCGGKLPETRYYQLASPAASTTRTGDAVLVLETLQTDQAYDDERIVYRTNPYRLDYYNYHRWSAAPGTLIGNYLETAFERTGKFRSVVRELAPNASVILGGRVVAIEEVDTPERWTGRIVVELSLTDARTGESLWSEQLEETEPLATKSPEG